MLAPDFFDLAMDWILHRHARCQRGDENFSDLDYADDVALFTELMELLQSALEVFSAEAAPIGLVVNWKKTKIKSLSDFLPPIGDLDIGDEQVEAVTSFTFLGVTTHSSCWSEQEISRRLGIARSSFRDMDHIWVSRLALHTKVILYNVGIVPIALYAPETWTMTQTDNNMLDAFDQWCLRRLWNVRWTDHVTNVTRAPELSRCQASPWLVQFCREIGPAVRHIASAPCQDTARLQTSERQTTLNMGLHGREGPLSPLNLGIFTALKKAEDWEHWKKIIRSATFHCRLEEIFTTDGIKNIIYIYIIIYKIIYIYMYIITLYIIYLYYIFYII